MTRRLARSAGVLACALLPFTFAACPSTARAASSPVMRLRAGALTCSATLVAPGYVLTARRCVARAGRAGSARLRVIAGAGSLRVFKVATIIAAPRQPGGAPDLALLQLTSPASLAPARLPARYTIPAARSRVAAVGWRKHSLARTVGRLRNPAVCGATVRRRHLRCAVLRRAPGATRCRDAAGAALLTRRHPTLIGVGTRSPRGCRSPARSAFTPVTRGVRAWIASAVAPTPATPGNAGNPVAAYVGTWTGNVSQDNLAEGSYYAASIRIDRAGADGEIIGTSAYPDPSGEQSGCGGTLQLLDTPNASLQLLERITYGQASCVDGGTVTLSTVSGQDAIAYSWTGGPSDGRASGVLRRAG